jgi:predicted nucleic acid-binding protein
MAPQDIVNATAMLRTLDTPLRTPDALHVVMAQRVGAQLMTFDNSSAARSLGIAVL